MNDWPSKPLKDVCDPSRAIAYGIVQPGKQFPGGVPIVRVNNFGASGLDLVEVLSVDPAIEKQYVRSRPQPSDVLITLVGSIGQVAIAPAEIGGWNLARAVGLLPMPDHHHAQWVLYSIKNRDAQEFIRQRANTTVQATFNLGDLAKLPIPYPDEPVRESILETLTAIDDRIELNRRMNETLEGMAQAIFRDWFADFGPTRRKAAGVVDPVAIMGGLSPGPARAAELAALFPAAFDSDGLPVGWAKQSIYGVASVIYGAPFASKRFNSEGVGRPLVRIRDLPKHGSELFTDEVHKREYVIQPGDIVVGMDGEFRARIWQGIPSLMNQRVCCFRPKSSNARAFVYFSVKPTLSQIEKSAVGTTVIHLGKSDIDRFTAVNPGGELIAAYGCIAEAMLDRLTANGLANRALAETRDYLLPRLMSGAVRVVPKAETA